MNIFQILQKITIKQLIIVNILSLFISAVVLLFLILPKDQQSNLISKNSSPTITPTPLPTPTPIPTPTPLPTSIKINGFSKISAKVVSIGFNPETNEMEVPHNVKEVGWYKYGPTPGDPGSTVMTAHYDTNTGAPGIFYNLKKVKPGDTFEIINDRNQKFTYEVKQIRNLPLYEWPEDKIFGEREYSQVTLITCAGVWNPIKKIYSNRLAVIGKLINKTALTNNENKIQANSEQYLAYPQKVPQSNPANPIKTTYLKLINEKNLVRVFLASNSNEITAVDTLLNISPNDIKDIEIMDLFESYDIVKQNGQLRISLFTDPKHKIKQAINTKDQEIELFNVSLVENVNIKNIYLNQANSKVLKNDPRLDPHLHPNILQNIFSN